MTEEEFKLHAEECKRALEHPEAPDDPDSDNDFEEWTFVNEAGKLVTVYRPNRKRLKQIVSEGEETRGRVKTDKAPPAQ